MTYLLESYGRHNDRGNSDLSIPQSLDYSSYKILNNSLQNVRLEPIKPSDRIKRNGSNLRLNNKGNLPMIERSPAFINSRNKFDVAKSVDVSRSNSK